jgi:hypothetical protein
LIPCLPKKVHGKQSLEKCTFIQTVLVFLE